MNLEIVSIHGHGDVDSEYVLLKAAAACDIGRYILADSTFFANGRISNRLRHFFWLPDKEIKKGEFVSVWTKAGANNSGVLNDGTPIHRFHWGLRSAVWNDEGDVAVLLHTDEWSIKKAR